ncbi:hypothetical protein OUZ56_029191 [Daphnia magna]|uniref:Uncharacterized protein n=1 Tax=Daphnia magna TaxID=35525 RepID=A0ABR0B632_9CRUS|nr:hypothetical protein OUZ56_029191 [Daphnia magna]
MPAKPHNGELIDRLISIKGTYIMQDASGAKRWRKKHSSKCVRDMFSPISDAHLIQLWKNLFAAKLVPDDGQLLAYCLLDVFNFHSIEIR